MAVTPQNPNVLLQRQLEQKSFEINYFQNQAQGLQTQVQILQKVLDDLENAKKSLSVAGELSNGTLLPLGVGVYAKAKAEKTGTVLLDVGARVLVEKKPQDAIAILDSRKSQVEKNLAEVTAAFERVVQRVGQLTDQAEAMARQAQGQ